MVCRFYQDRAIREYDGRHASKSLVGLDNKSLAILIMIDIDEIKRYPVPLKKTRRAVAIGTPANTIDFNLIFHFRYPQ